MSEYYASYKQPKYSFNELSRFENPVKIIVNHLTMRGNLLESAPVGLSLSGNKRIDRNQIRINKNFKKLLFRRPKNVKVWKWLWDGAGGGRRPPEVPSHNHFHTSTFFGRREKKKNWETLNREPKSFFTQKCLLYNISKDEPSNSNGC